jgi:signal peptidase II
LGYYLRFWVVLTLVLGLDQWTKSLVVESAVELRRNPILVVDGFEGPEAFFEITYVTNPGAAWSMFSDYPQVLTVLAIIALLAIWVFRKHLELDRYSLQIVFGMISGGIAGNLGDRLFREPAEVVDFIDLYLPWIRYDYPIFNIADSAIFTGAISYMIIGILDSKIKKSQSVA